jgi:hypothetical protein
MDIALNCPSLENKYDYSLRKGFGKNEPDKVLKLWLSIFIPKKTLGIYGVKSESTNISGSIM